jgi:hypothetical protein
VVAPAQRSPAAEARAHKQKSQAVAKKLKLKMIFKKVQEGCKIRRTYGIFGYDRRDKLFYFRWRWSFSPAFEAVPFRRTRQLRARRDTAKTEATAAEKRLAQKLREGE